MNTNACDITLILDRSYSMSARRMDVIDGTNMFLREQRRIDTDTKVSLVQFDDKYEVVYTGLSLPYAKDLTVETYVPRGNTALLDAVGRTIIDTGERLRRLPEEQRPGKVVMVIITDGWENASREFKGGRVRELIQHQANVYKWQFVYLGANVDAFAEASNLGIVIDNAMQFNDKTSMGVKHMYSTLSQNVAMYRGGQADTLAFSTADREANK